MEIIHHLGYDATEHINDLLTSNDRSKHIIKPDLGVLAMEKPERDRHDEADEEHVRDELRRNVSLGDLHIYVRKEAYGLGSRRSASLLRRAAFRARPRRWRRCCTIGPVITLW